MNNASASEMHNQADLALLLSGLTWSRVKLTDDAVLLAAYVALRIHGNSEAPAGDLAMGVSIDWDHGLRLGPLVVKKGAGAIEVLGR